MIISTNSTFSSNTATGSSGGGIYNANATLTLINTTFSGNSAGSNGGGIRADGGGTVFMYNTVIANSSSGGDCFGAGTFTSQGYNLDSDSTCNLVGTGDKPGQDPLLGPLQNNGGPTFTHEIQTGSPAIDTADNTSCPATDQRGITRPQGAKCDTGAYEVAVAAPSVPALSQWAILVLAILLSGAVIRRSRRLARV